MSISWPAAPFPQSFLVGQSVNAQYNNNTIRTAMDTGSAKVRPRDTVFFNTYTGTILLTTAQKQQLDTFFNTTTASGSIPFLLADPVGGSVLTWLLTSQPLYTYVGGVGATQYWHAKITLEQVP